MNLAHVTDLQAAREWGEDVRERLALKDFDSLLTLAHCALTARAKTAARQAKRRKARK